MNLKILLSCALISTFATLTYSQQGGVLDSTFNNVGIVVTSLGTVEERAFCLDIQDDGRIVVGGTFHNGFDKDAIVLRYLPDGTLDTTFNVIGYTITNISIGNEAVRDIVVQTNGKIVVVGETPISTSFGIFVARYNSNGILDQSFGNNGITLPDSNIIGEASAHSCIIDTLGGIFIGGGGYNGFNHDFLLMKFDSAGIIDSSFNGNGILLTDFGFVDSNEEISFLSNGSIISVGASARLSGAEIAMTKCFADGTIDSLFGTDGMVSFNLVNLGFQRSSLRSIVVDTLDNIFVGGYVQNSNNDDDFLLMKFYPEGTLDSLFGTNGVCITPVSSGDDVILQLAMQSDGKLLAAGYSSHYNFTTGNFCIARYLPNGTIDNSFGINGIVETNIGGNLDFAFDMKLQADEKIVLAGQSFQNGKFNIALARYRNDLGVGSNEMPLFNKSSIIVFPNPATEEVHLKFYQERPSQVSTSLMDQFGKILLEESFYSSTQGYCIRSIEIPADVSPGVYFLRVLVNNSVFTEKLLVY